MLNVHKEKNMQCKIQRSGTHAALLFCILLGACQFADPATSGEPVQETDLTDPLSDGVEHPHPVVSQRQGERLAKDRAQWSQKALLAQSAISKVLAIKSATCARKGESQIKCWGLNINWSLGANPITLSTTHLPTPVQSLTEPLRSFSAGATHVCAVTQLGAMKCFGDNSSAQLGINSSANSFAAVSPARLADGVLWSASGFEASCAIVRDNRLKCWGENIGTPQDVPGAERGVFQVTVGYRHKCLLNENFGVQCWGANESGQLGTKLSVASVDMPLSVEGLDTGVVQVAAGHSHSCALNGSGSVFCWGKNDHGQLGDGSTAQRTEPVEITSLGSDVLALSLATDYSCALKAGGAVWCWGNNSKGQLGDGTLSSRSVPSEVLSLQPENIALSAGSGHACAMDSMERIQCWGEERFGQLGAAATYGNNVAPVSVVDF